MDKPLGFRDLGRQPLERQPVQDRVRHWREFDKTWSEEQASRQGSRCMDCAVPFCHMGCPLGNLIPEFNELVYRGQWLEALKRLLATNNFPEFTGRICPAPCEASCVLAINQDPVTIEHLERTIVDRGFQEGWIKPEPPASRTGKKVAVVGSGPAGLAAAQQLNRAGHAVTVLERDEHVGGLLALGIPEFKLEKAIVKRRIELMAAEGVIFRAGITVGANLPVSRLLSDFDAICLAGGSTKARDLDIPGRELQGINTAMEYLAQQNRVQAGEYISPESRITAEGKRVVILGGGDTGSDCLGTAHRQGAAGVYQLELLPEPPEERLPENPWPQWPVILMSTAAQEEGGIRDYNILTKRLSGGNGAVERLHAVRLEWGPPDDSGRLTMNEIPGSEFEIETDLVLLALGFVHPEREGLLNELGVDLDDRGNVATDESLMTSVPGIFAAGDMRRGQSLVVWAIAEGREAAHHIDTYLMGTTSLPRLSR
jgi:glutamate synthase (NADPH/NADH) small chain